MTIAHEHRPDGLEHELLGDSPGTEQVEVQVIQAAPRSFFKRNRLPIVAGTTALVTGLVAGFFIPWDGSGEKAEGRDTGVAAGPINPGAAPGSTPSHNNKAGGPHVPVKCTGIDIQETGQSRNGHTIYDVAAQVAILSATEAPDDAHTYTWVLDEVSGKRYVQQGRGAVEVEGVKRGGVGIPTTIVLDTWGTDIDPITDPTVQHGSLDEIQHEFPDTQVSLCAVKFYP